MACRRTGRIAEIKQKLAVRITHGSLPAGARFFSTRGLAEHYGISFRTAHKLLGELVQDGALVRRRGSGTYLRGTRQRLNHVQLVFPTFARQVGTYGNWLLRQLVKRLDRAGIVCHVTWVRHEAKFGFDGDGFPIVWGRDLCVLSATEQKRHILTFSVPRYGMQSEFVEVIGLDSEYGARKAADILLASCPGRRLAVFSCMPQDPQSTQRVVAFRERAVSHGHAPDPAVIYAGGWLRKDGVKHVAELLQSRPEGVFCVNDELAGVVLDYCKERGIARPAVVGFDDGPDAERRNLTTIGTPWDDVVRLAVDVASRRLAGSLHCAAYHILLPRPVYRLSHVPETVVPACLCAEPSAS